MPRVTKTIRFSLVLHYVLTVITLVLAWAVDVTPLPLVVVMRVLRVGWLEEAALADTCCRIVLCMTGLTTCFFSLA